MNRRKWLWAALLAVPVVVGSSLAYASTQRNAGGFTCPVTGESLPCEQCCPLNKAAQPQVATEFTCPVTGETLPCEKCCPLNGEKAAPVEAKAAKPTTEAAGEYLCPVTGETLGCPNCCPLNKAK